LTDLLPHGDFEADQLLQLVGTVEAQSEHPLGRAIVKAAEEKQLQPLSLSGFEALPGYGVQARADDKVLLIGTAKLLQREGVKVDALVAQAESLADAGKTPIYVSIDGRLAGLLAVADTIKTGSGDAVRSLQTMGLRVMMISGDNTRTAHAVAAQLGITEVRAEVLPADKASTVAGLRQAGDCVTYVGDGINDAPALAEADVGMAMGNGTDVAMESADVVLVSGDLRGIVQAIALARATLRNIKQNLFWAFAYNTALIPVAAGLLYPFVGILLSPVLAAGAMALSSVFVVTNALRLRGFVVQRQTLPDGA